MIAPKWCGPSVVHAYKTCFDTIFLTGNRELNEITEKNGMVVSIKCQRSNEGLKPGKSSKTMECHG